MYCDFWNLAVTVASYSAVSSDTPRHTQAETHVLLMFALWATHMLCDSFLGASPQPLKVRSTGVRAASVCL